MTKREILINTIKSKYRNGDEEGAMRIYFENRIISYDTYMKAIREERINEKK